MVFSSLEFLLLFLTVTLLVYFVVPLKLRNIVLLVVSLIFYGWGEPVYVFLMIFTITVDYIFGLLVERAQKRDDPKRARLHLILSVVINLAILGFFKYYNFFVSNLRLIPGLGWLPLLGIELPIGISFYTFQALSYVIDVYRRDTGAQHNIASFGAYVTLYPQLIAGPIVRYKDVDDQLTVREHSVPLFAEGCRTFIAGMGKKILLANTAGQLWEYFRAIPTDERTVAAAWMGMLCYAFQIYFDFSGYSDMAIGLGKMIGFRFIENFDYPYISKSITEFWRRWHMSLSTWFRDYVYIPLGGNRCSKFKQLRNIFVVWFLTGFWHGASWNYILWGIYYFVLLMIEKTFLLDKLKKAPAFVSHIYTLFFILFGWLLFVFEDLSAGFVWLGNMFGVGTAAAISSGDIYNLVRNLIFFVILAIAATPLPKKLYRRLTEKSNAARIVASAGGIVMLLVCMAYLVDSSFNPFLYFRF
ncbi:MAG TPA: MBOAT family protein [Firmicutes bacterium]|nr:MBOAT family protein [Bacillota bacterium]